VPYRIAWHRRMEARVALGVTLLVGAAIAAVLIAATQVVTSRSAAQAADDLTAARAAFRQLLETRARSAQTVARLVTALPVFRAHLADPQLAADGATVGAMADGYRAELNAAFAAVLDGAGRLIAAPGWSGDDTDGWQQTLSRAAAADAGHVGIATLGGRLYLLVSEPAMFGEERLGTLSIGYALDDRVAKELAGSSLAEVTFVSGGAVSGSSLGPAARRDMVAALAAGTWSAGDAGREPQPLGGTRYVAALFPLAIGDAGTSESSAQVVLLRDWTRTERFVGDLRRQLLTIGAASFVMALVVGLVFSRRTTQPIRELACAAVAITAGDRARRAPLVGSAEAVATAAAFNEMSDELVAACDRALDVSRLKSEFLANVSHELRTPLNGILGMTTIVFDSIDDAEQRENLAVVRSAARALLGTIEQLLDFSAIDAGRLDVRRSRFALADLVTAAVTPLEAQAAEKGIALSTDLTDDLPQRIVSDPVRLRQVLDNLIGNAVKFTDRGRVVCTVRAAERSAGRVRLKFAVSDTGIGIAADKHADIFDAFSQVDGSTTRRFGGTGLGLAIASNLVMLMGGRLWVDSQPGVGSTFYFTLDVTAA
jgi:signal transduction histidine kinase